jgi:hypothetical protein
MTAPVAGFHVVALYWMLAHAVDASDRRRTGVIFIAAKFQVLPEHADDWSALGELAVPERG